jgi:hypothetical protein
LADLATSFVADTSMDLDRVRSRLARIRAEQDNALVIDATCAAPHGEGAAP